MKYQSVRELTLIFMNYSDKFVKLRTKVRRTFRIPSNSRYFKLRNYRSGVICFSTRKRGGFAGFYKKAAAPVFGGGLPAFTAYQPVLSPGVE
jgi:hypothetical protein